MVDSLIESFTHSSLFVIFQEPICVVIEFVSGGSLDKVLKASHVPNQNAYTAYTNVWSRLTERELLSIALDVANGMKHLESRQVRNWIVVRMCILKEST